MRNCHFGGKGGRPHEYEIAAGEIVTRISGTKIKFLGHDTIGQITITTSTGQVIGPYGHNGNRNQNSPRPIISKFVYDRQPSQRIFAVGVPFLKEIGFVATEDTNYDCDSCASTNYTIEHIEQVGNPLKINGINKVTTGSDYNQCLADCTKYPECTVVTYDSIEKACYLKGTFSPDTNSKHIKKRIGYQLLFSQKCTHSNCPNT